jgi:hypothetical protein
MWTVSLAAQAAPSDTMNHQRLQGGTMLRGGFNYLYLCKSQYDTDIIKMIFLIAVRSNMLRFGTR